MSMLRYLIRKQQGDQQERQPTSATDTQVDRQQTLVAETQHQQPIQDVHIQVGDDISEEERQAELILEVGDDEFDRQQVPETLQHIVQVDDEERRPNASTSISEPSSEIRKTSFILI
jgi:hypothetical protein